MRLPLLATDTAGDRFLEHSVAYALYEIDDVVGLSYIPPAPEESPARCSPASAPRSLSPP